MRGKVALLLALLGVLAGMALTRRLRAPDLLSRAALEQLLDRPLDPPPGAPAGDPSPAWRALLAQLAEPGEHGLTLRLAHVLADPTAARASADSAGELLALEAQGPEGEPGGPLWRAILASPALEHGPPPTLRLNGCRHSALSGDGPALEDSYSARLSLARALQELAATEPGSAALVLSGEHVPVRGGVNFEVQLQDGTQSVSVTFDGHAGASLRATRPLRPVAPNDARARANLVDVLRERAQSAGLGPLTVVDVEPATGTGVDVRIELLGGRQSLVARRGTTRLATHRVLDESGARQQ